MWDTLARPVRAIRSDTEDTNLRNGHVMAIGEEGRGGITVLFCDQNGLVTPVPLAVVTWDARAITAWAQGTTAQPSAQELATAGGAAPDDQRSWTGGPPGS